LLGLAGCSSDIERRTARELDRVEAQLAPLVDPQRASEPAPAVNLDGSIEAYVAYAYSNSPELRASFEAWRAASYGSDRVRRLPEPTLTYAAFVRSVETRVGPQQHKLGIMQWFPWPTRLTAAGKAEAYRAEAAQRRFDALALDIAAQVQHAYWELWLVDRQREVEKTQVVILEGLSQQLKFRMETGRADFGNVAQVDLGISRLRDAIAGLDETQRGASATLVETIGAPAGTATPVLPASPPVTLPTEETAALAADARSHPRVETMALHVDASKEDARAARANFAPSLGVGVDWIITGPAPDPSIADSGKDPVIVMGALKVPLWGGSYRAGVRQAEARGRMYRAREIAAMNTATADVERQLASVRDSARRVDLYRSTLVPQAETTYGSVAASFEAGRAGVAELLMAERDLLELHVARFGAEARHAAAWAELERIVGRPVPGKEEER
jgi:outer membrane protein TolC